MERLKEKVVLVPCTLRRSAFPHERAFVIPFPDGSEYRGVVPAAYCRRADRTPAGDWPDGGESAPGLVVGLLFARDGDTSRVQLPDGDVYRLPADRFEAPEGSP